MTSGSCCFVGAGFMGGLTFFFCGLDFFEITLLFV